MLFNADKSEILSIRSQRAAASLQESDPVIHPISMNGVRVPACQKHKHLGVVINNSLSWSDHIDDVFHQVRPSCRYLELSPKETQQEMLDKDL